MPRLAVGVIIYRNYVLRNRALPLPQSLFYIFLNVSCVYRFSSMRQEIYRCLCWRGGKNGAHKHLCSSVGGYRINPPPKGGRICIAWEGEKKKDLLTDFAGAQICEKPRKSSTLIARRKSLSSTIPNNISNITTFFSPPPLSPPASI